MRTGKLGIEPYRSALMQPSSIDVLLGRIFRTFVDGVDLDPSSPEDHTDIVEVPVGEPLVMRPGAVVLGHTVETITIGNDRAARCEGKSSLGRLGLSVHSTAGFIDPGFSGQVTLELINQHRTNRLILWPGMRIAQICVFQVSSPAAVPYGRCGHYQHQIGPVASRAWDGWKVWDDGQR